MAKVTPAKRHGVAALMKLDTFHRGAGERHAGIGWSTRKLNEGAKFRKQSLEPPEPPPLPETNKEDTVDPADTKVPPADI